MGQDRNDLAGITRRDFLRYAAVAGGGLATYPLLTPHDSHAQDAGSITPDRPVIQREEPFLAVLDLRKAQKRERRGTEFYMFEVDFPKEPLEHLYGYLVGDDRNTRVALNHEDGGQDLITLTGAKLINGKYGSWNGGT